MAMYDQSERDMLRNKTCSNAVLLWFCRSCDWSVEVAMPGYAGDGYYHYLVHNQPCGPLYAVRSPGFKRKDVTCFC